MIAREPPALATWLLMRLVTGDRGESLLGDLFEEYQTGRSAAWYWRETVAALLLFARGAARNLVSSRPAQVLVSLIAPAALLLWLVMRSEAYRQRCPTPTALAHGPLTLMTGAVLAALAIPLLLRLASLREPGRWMRRPGLARLSAVAFALIGFGGGALGWAATSACATDSLACRSSYLTAAACAHRADGISPRREPLGHGASAEAPRHLHRASLP